VTPITLVFFSRRSYYCRSIYALPCVTHTHHVPILSCPIQFRHSQNQPNRGLPRAGHPPPNARLIGLFASKKGFPVLWNHAAACHPRSTSKTVFFFADPDAALRRWHMAPHLSRSRAWSVWRLPSMYRGSIPPRVPHRLNFRRWTLNFRQSERIIAATRSVPYVIYHAVSQRLQDPARQKTYLARGFSASMGDSSSPSTLSPSRVAS
jgi:hypothetical protein